MGQSIQLSGGAVPLSIGRGLLEVNYTVLWHLHTDRS